MLYKTLSAPMIAQLEMTTECNNRCRYCYNYWRACGIDDATLTSEQATQVIAKLAEKGVFRVVISGGEPLLPHVKESTFSAISVAKQLNLVCHLNSNLTTLTAEDAIRLKQASVDSVLASLISNDEQTHDWLASRKGAYNQTVRGIQLLATSGVRVGVSMVLNPYNADHVITTGKLVKELGARGFYVTKASCPVSCTDFDRFRVSQEVVRRSLEELLNIQDTLGLTVDILEAYPHCLLENLKRYERFARRRCGGGIATCVIGATGEIRACTHDDHAYGNIFTDGLVTPWKQMTDWRDGSNLPQLCLDCKYLAGCGGGCRIEARQSGQNENKDPFATTPSDVRDFIIERDVAFLKEFASKRIEINPSVVIREEKFGGIASAGSISSMVALLNHEAVTMLRTLMKNGPILVDKLATNFNKDRIEMLAFLYDLYVRNILILVTS